MFVIDVYKTTREDHVRIKKIKKRVDSYQSEKEGLIGD
jgi:hypothetical protein